MHGLKIIFGHIEIKDTVYKLTNFIKFKFFNKNLNFSIKNKYKQKLIYAYTDVVKDLNLTVVDIHPAWFNDVY